MALGSRPRRPDGVVDVPVDRIEGQEVGGVRDRLPSGNDVPLSDVVEVGRLLLRGPAESDLLLVRQRDVDGLVEQVLRLVRLPVD